MFQTPAILTSISHTKDKGRRVGFVTQELTEAEGVLLERHFQQFGWLLFSENEFQEKDVPKMAAIRKGKSKSQILRQHIWRLWKNSNSTLTEDEHYNITMDKLIKFIDRKINE